MGDCASNFQIRSDMRIADGHNRDHRNLGHRKFSITLRDGFAIRGSVEQDMRAENHCASPGRAMEAWALPTPPGDPICAFDRKPSSALE
jgi:hypothetical protein